MASVCRWLTLKESEPGLVAADVLAVRQWWLQERRMVLACWLVEMAAVCQSVGSSSQIENFLRIFRALICCVGLFRL